MRTCTRHPALDAWGDYDRDDPFPLFAQVRAAGPVHEVRLADGHPAWLVVGHEEARAALNDPRLSKDMHAALARSGEVVAEGLPGPALARHMLAVDPPDHTRLRRLAMPAFSRRRVDGAGGPGPRRSSQRLLDDLAARGGTDRVVDLVAGLRVPAAVHGDLRAARHPGAGPRRPRPVVPHPARPVPGPQPPAEAVAASERSSATSPRCSTASAPRPARTWSPTSSSPPTATARSPSRRCSPRSSSWSSPGTTPPPA